jgi:hypothetical protein
MITNTSSDEALYSGPVHHIFSVSGYRHLILCECNATFVIA